MASHPTAPAPTNGSAAKPNGFKVQLTPAAPSFKRSDTVESQAFFDAPEAPAEEQAKQDEASKEQQRLQLQRNQPSIMSYMSVPPPGSVLTGKQEHYLKR